MKQELPARYTIRRTEDFIKKSHELGKRFSRVKELIKAIDWALERRPHYFTNISSDYYLWVTTELSNDDFPEVKILYKIVEDDFEVVLLDIEET